MGSLTLDLGGDWPARAEADVRLDGSMGEFRVDVPKHRARRARLERVGVSSVRPASHRPGTTRAPRRRSSDCI